MPIVSLIPDKCLARLVAMFGVILLAMVGFDGKTVAAGAGARTTPPLADKRPVEDTFFGVKVVEDYRWLEAGGASDVKAWTKAHAAWAKAKLDGLSAVGPIAKRLGDA